tara:strand:- start:888 stop:1214 length:327 start_codon:yes stop_codon:yes gene_type:complete
MLVSPSKLSNNHKLFFSKSEISKILNCYSIGVSKGNWKDYALNFNSNEAIFCFFKHSLASPDCILIKYKEKKKKRIIYKLSISNKKNSKFENLDNLIIDLKRTQISLI